MMNSLDTDCGEILAMAARAPVLLLPFLLEDQNLVGAIVLKNGGFHRDIWQRSTGLNLAAIFHHQHIAELNLRTNLAREALQPQGLTWRDPVLFAARTYHGVHGYIPFRKDKRLFYGARTAYVNEGFGEFPVVIEMALPPAGCSFRNKAVESQISMYLMGPEPGPLNCGILCTSLLISCSKDVTTTSLLHQLWIRCGMSPQRQDRRSFSLWVTEEKPFPKI